MSPFIHTFFVSHDLADVAGLMETAFYLGLYQLLDLHYFCSNMPPFSLNQVILITTAAHQLSV